MTAFFLVTTVTTSVTGFFFPFRGLTPAYGVGAISIFILAGAIYALYVRQLSGVWGKVYVINAVTALYLNFSPGRTALPKNSRLERARANPDRTTLRHIAGHRVAAFCRVGHRSGAPIPSRAHEGLRKFQGRETCVAFTRFELFFGVGKFRRTTEDRFDSDD